ncbi:hypothetical protein C489_21011 [Natrinema versiforme JCM 10478]|uniref:Uncharacterized protein n=1 Tax=Natrinema versiforme JCM 10478 TaxID=1227496 RepID=L9XMJ9_9EURY|nr:hypothetical protein C489_21011 [Natrinema versiforme JCM 10478]
MVPVEILAAVVEIAAIYQMTTLGMNLSRQTIITRPLIPLEMRQTLETKLTPLAGATVMMKIL